MTSESLPHWPRENMLILWQATHINQNRVSAKLQMTAYHETSRLKPWPFKPQMSRFLLYLLCTSKIQPILIFKWRLHLDVHPEGSCLHRQALFHSQRRNLVVLATVHPPPPSHWEQVWFGPVRRWLGESCKPCPRKRAGFLNEAGPPG